MSVTYLVPAKPNDYKRGCSFQSNQIAALQHDLGRDKRLIAKRFCSSAYDAIMRINVTSVCFGARFANANTGVPFEPFLPVDTRQ
jgi:hypothetical protein